MRKLTYNAAILKIIAVLAMFCDHFAWRYLEFATVGAQLLHIIGRLTIPVMCFFIAEGYRHTTNIKRYLFRLAIFGMITVIPFYLFFGKMYGYRQNFLIDLLMGLCLLIVLEHSKWPRVWRLVGAVGIFVVSIGFGGWPVLPLVYILIFYYGKSFKQQAYWFVGITLGIVTVCTVCLVAIGKVPIIGFYGEWYELLYILGFMLALPLLGAYNSQRGMSKTSSMVFYLIYPLHFLVLMALPIPLDFTAHGIYVGMFIVTIIVIFTLLMQSIRLENSNAQMANVVLLGSSLVFLMSYLGEVTTDNMDVIFGAIKMEYVGLCGVIIGYTWFLDTYCKLRLNRHFYVGEFLMTLNTCYHIFQIETSTYFYTGRRMDYSGPFPQIILEHGPMFYSFYAYFMIVFVAAVWICIRKRRRCKGTERKRFNYLIIGSFCPWICMTLKLMGVLGPYDFMMFGIAGTAICFTIVLMRYGYYNSVQVAREHALNHGTEGLLVVDNNNRVVYYNKIMKWLLRDLENDMDISKIDTVHGILEGEEKQIHFGKIIYEMRVEALEEDGYQQGFMLWAVNITKYMEKIMKIQNEADTDALTGLHNRGYMMSAVQKFLDLKKPGAMMMFDMDNFKYINDTLGHGAGDEVLIAFGEVLKEALRSTDLTCRMGGDEFCAFVLEQTKEEVLARIASRIIVEFKKALEDRGYPTVTTVSVGITLYKGEQTTSFPILYSEADRALYHSKNHGKNRYTFNHLIEEKEL